MAAAGAARAAALAANAVKKTKGGNVAERENSDTMTRQQLLSKLKDDEDLFYLFNIGEGRGPSEPPPPFIDEIETIASVPDQRPPFLSPFSFAMIQEHFRHQNFNESFMGAFFRGKYELPDCQKPLDSLSFGSKVDEELVQPPPIEGPYWMQTLNNFILMNQLLANSTWFNGLVIFCICAAGVLVGVQSYPSMESNSVLNVCDVIIQNIFGSECIFKIFAEGTDPMRYFNGPDWAWNNFDFWLVLICYMPEEAIPIGNVAFLRLLRLMRLLKLVGKVKQLQLIVMGLINGLRAVWYILVLMLLIFYLFAVMGVDAFRKNDPFHFGSVGVAMLTLFRMSTLEDWSDIMFLNYYGCDSQYAGVDGLYYGKNGEQPYVDRYDKAVGGPGKRDYMQTDYGYFPLNECWKPQGQPLYAAVFSILFVLIAAFVMLSLFIGAVCGGMGEALEEFKNEAETARLEKEEREYRIQALQAEKEVRESNELLSSIASEDGGDEREFGHDEHDEPIFMFGLGNDDLKAGRTPSQISLAQVERDQKERRCKEMRHSLMLMSRIRDARNGENTRWDFELINNWFLRSYLRVAVVSEKIANHPWFVNLVTATILLAGVVVGIQTELFEPGPSNHTTYPTLDLLDTIIFWIFAAEVFFKLIGEGDTPLHYFRDSWNCFDFFIVAACAVFMLPLNLPNLSFLAMLRLLRLLRVLKLVKALPQLRIIIEALISGFGSISFVTIILFMFFYLFANIGMILFAKNDPMHFGNLQLSLLTLFRASTLDDWTDIMYVNMYGCDRHEYVYGKADVFGPGNKGKKKLRIVNCNNPQAFGWIGALYMVSFIVLGALVLLTLFIGIVATSMEEAKEGQKADEADERKLAKAAEALPVAAISENKLKYSLLLLRNIYDSMDKKGESLLDRDEMKPIYDILPLLTTWKKFEKLSKKYREKLLKSPPSKAVRAEHELRYVEAVIRLVDRQEGKRSTLKRQDVDNFIKIIDEEYEGSLRFSHFVLLVDFFRRVEEKKSIVLSLRNDESASLTPNGSSIPPITEVPEEEVLQAKSKKVELNQGKKGPSRLRKGSKRGVKEDSPTSVKDADETDDVETLQRKLMELYQSLSHLQDENKQLKADLAGAKRGALLPVPTDPKPPVQTASGSPLGQRPWNPSSDSATAKL